MRRILHIAAIIAAGLVATPAIAGDLCVDPGSFACKAPDLEGARHRALKESRSLADAPLDGSTHPAPVNGVPPWALAIPLGTGPGGAADPGVLLLLHPPPPDPGNPGVTTTPGHRGPYHRR